MNSIVSDFRYALRGLRKNPSLTAVAVATLAIGIGAATAIFSVVRTTLIRPLPYSSASRLVLLSEETKEVPGMSVSYPNFKDWVSQNHVFDRMALFTRWRMNLTGSGEPQRISAWLMTSDFFPTLSVVPLRGRFFDAREDVRGAPPAAILSHGFWQRQMGGDPEAIGKTIHLDGRVFTVIGIAPANFQTYFAFSAAPDVMVPLGTFLVDPDFDNRGSHPGLYVVGRLRPDVTLVAARHEMDAIAARLALQYPASNAGHRVGVHPLSDDVTVELRPSLLVLMTAAGLLLLLTCANLANVLLGRSIGRRRELGVRVALGAPRGRLVRQLLFESGALAVAGGIAALPITFWAVALARQAAPLFTARLADARVEPAILLFAAGLSMATAVLFGLVPALHAARHDPSDLLRGTSRTAGPSHETHRLRRALVVGEILVSTVLLVGTGLLIRSFVAASRVDPGFDAAGLLTGQVSLPPSRYPTDEKVAAFYREALAKLRGMPGVDEASGATPLPLSGGGRETGYLPEGASATSAADLASVEVHLTAPDYFHTMKTRLTIGREFLDSDRDGSLPVVVINQAMARRCWPGQIALGKKIRFGGFADLSGAGLERNRSWTVVGVSQDGMLDGLDRSPRPEAFFSLEQRPIDQLTFVVRTSRRPDSISSALGEAIRQVDPDLPVSAVEPMTSILRRSLAKRSLASLLMGFFAVAAIALVGLGTYSVLGAMVAQRRSELGIRMSLGAVRADVIALVMCDGLRMAVAGTLFGLAAAVPLAALLRSQLFNVAPDDPATFGAAALFLLAITSLAAYLPARRAAKVDPAEALRNE